MSAHPHAHPHPSPAWDAVRKYVDAEWDNTIVPCLCEYIKVPNQSPHYDPEWATNGLTMKAFKVLTDWIDKQHVEGMTYELADEPGRTPFLFVEIKATHPVENEKTVMMYGHMDKQPPLPPWAEGLDPYVPVLREGKLYGRGGADDGYAICAAVTSVVALQKNKVAHGRVVITIEAREESGSEDLEFYITKYKQRMGDIDLIVCLDSGAMDFDTMWLTSSLRGVIGGVLTVSTLKEGMHSGVAGGIVPDSFRIARSILDRIEDPITGDIKVQELFVPIPESVKKDMESLRSVDFMGGFSLHPETKHEGTSSDPAYLALRNFWTPCMTVTGADMPSTSKAGNVIRRETALKLSIRLPPTCNPAAVTDVIRKTLESDPPMGAHVTYVPESAGAGWAAPALHPWLRSAVEDSSKAYFGKSFGTVGLGGSIPFMGMLGLMFPAAQFVVTGVLGPQSNAHGPNEFLHVPFAKGVNYCVSRVLAAHAIHSGK